MKYTITKIRNGRWVLEWESGSKSEHSTQWGAERMVMLRQRNDLKYRILREFYDVQCYEDSGLYNDESHVITYPYLCREVQAEKNEVKPLVLELRNDGFIKMVQAVDYDGFPSGRGYTLTDKGADLVKSAFYKETE